MWGGLNGTWLQHVWHWGICRHITCLQFLILRNDSGKELNVRLCDGCKPQCVSFATSASHGTRLLTCIRCTGSPSGVLWRHKQHLPGLHTACCFSKHENGIYRPHPAKKENTNGYSWVGDKGYFYQKQKWRRPSVVLNWRCLCPPRDIQQHLKSFYGCHSWRECYWHLEGSGRGCCKTSYNVQDSLNTKNVPVQNVSSAKVEKPGLDNTLSWQVQFA